jgi:hypothetical protein
MSDQGTPPPPPEPGYGDGGSYVAPHDHPQGTIILMFGIISLVPCGLQLLGPVAWIMGNRALATIDANPSWFTNRSTVNAGRICGIIGTAELVITIAILIFSFAVGSNN